MHANRSKQFSRDHGSVRLASAARCNPGLWWDGTCTNDSVVSLIHKGFKKCLTIICTDGTNDAVALNHSSMLNQPEQWKIMLGCVHIGGKLWWRLAATHTSNFHVLLQLDMVMKVVS